MRLILRVRRHRGHPHCQCLRYVLESTSGFIPQVCMTVTFPEGRKMKKLISLLALGLTMAVGAAHAADAAAPTAQQGKMKTCNVEAKDKKGDERKAFMKECLSAKPAAPATQQSKMKTCNVDAQGMKGDERKKFMSECLKK
jgi:hypothetical protein